MPARSTKVFTSQVVKVDAFPKQMRQSTVASPYTSDVADMVDKGAHKFYALSDQSKGVASETEAKELGNSLRAVARRLHNRSLTIVFIPKDTPTHARGLYAKDGGEITPKPRKANGEIEAPAPVKSPAKKATARTRKTASR